MILFHLHFIFYMSCRCPN